MLFLLAAVALSQDEPPLPPREFRAAWVATVDNIDWPSKRTLSSAQAQAELTEILNKAQKMRLNALIFQVRPHADALYDSSIEPWSEYLTGQQGKKPNPYWDPLATVVKEAHLRGIEVHAWFNPYRAWHPQAVSQPAPNFIGRTQPEIVKQYGKFKWMDPGDARTQDHSVAVMMDVVKRYDIDGVHIDDYFYPYKSYAPGMDFPDSASYGASGQSLSRDDWRRKSVDDFVRRLYLDIKKSKPWVKFGISPFGIYRPGHPADVKAGMDQFKDLYADARKWLVEGWCDYYSPQLYWPIKGDQPYPSLLKWWVANNPKGRHIWPGLFTGKVSKELGNWSPDEIVNQIKLNRENGRATGHVHFSMRAFTNKWKDIDAVVTQQLYRGPALVPASPWLDAERPKQPKLRSERFTGGTRVHLEPADRKDVRWFAYYVKERGSWRLAAVLSGSTSQLAIEDSFASKSGLEAIAVSSVDACGNEGSRYRLSLRP